MYFTELLSLHSNMRDGSEFYILPQSTSFIASMLEKSETISVAA